MAEVAIDRGLHGNPDETIKEHVIDRYGQVWRLVRDGGMATRADYAGIVSVGIDHLERFAGPLVNLLDAVREGYLWPSSSIDQPGLAEEIDRNARAYGWETHKRGRLVAKGETSEDNPFLDPHWRDRVIVEALEPTDG